MRWVKYDQKSQDVIKGSPLGSLSVKCRVTDAGKAGGKSESAARVGSVKGGLSATSHLFALSAAAAAEALKAVYC